MICNDRLRVKRRTYLTPKVIQVKVVVAFINIAEPPEDIPWLIVEGINYQAYLNTTGKCNFKPMEYKVGP